MSKHLCWKRAEVKNQVKSSNRIQNLLLKQPNPVHSGICQIQQLSSDMLTEILVILVLLELRQHRKNMNNTQAVEKKREQTSHVTTSVRVFSMGLSEEDFIISKRCGFSSQLTEERICFSFAFVNALEVSKC